MQVPKEVAAQYQDVPSAQDIPIYGGLCALASGSTELHSCAIHNVSWLDDMRNFGSQA